MAENQYGFPTEVLSLPSKGLLYPEDSPLRSGTIDVKYMTAKEEDILTSTNLIAQGKVIERLLESVIVTPNVKLDDLLVGDKNAVMMGTRILGYGSEYNVSVNDPETNEEVELQVDLTTLQPKELDEKLLEKGENKFEFELPNSKRKVEFKLLDGHDEKKIEETLKELEKVEQLTGVSSELTTRIKQQLISVDGNTEKSFINNFVDNEFLALDTRAYRKYVSDITPDIDMSFDYRTKRTGKEIKVDVPLGVEFFGQPVSNRPALHENLFDIVYHGQGFTYTEIYHMPLPLRRYYTDLMIKAKKKESDEIDKMNNNPAFKKLNNLIFITEII